MPKKQARNAFFFFMKELEPQLRREGRVLSNGMADVAEIAHPRYKMLPQKDRDRFEKMAKDAKAKMRGKAGDFHRLDNQGTVLAYRKDEFTELDKRRAQEKKDMIKDWPVGKDLMSVPFYFIHFQTLCKIEKPEECLPCEIAVIEYTIERGITKSLHRFIEPGRIMTGYRFTCESHSADTHQIPVENFELADTNYTGLWMQIENFINPGREKDENPPLFCLGASGNYKVVECCLDWIHGRACLGEPNRIRKVYELEALFQEIHAHIGNKVSKSQCVDLLTSSEWEYEPNTRCKYHEEKEVKHCSLGVVNRYSYAISDNLCEKYFGILPTKNHLPMRNEINSFVALPRSAMPVCPNQESRMPPKSDYLSRPRQQHHRGPAVKTEPEEDYQELRRPKMPDYPATPAWGGNVVGGIKSFSDADFPEMKQDPSRMTNYPGMSSWGNNNGGVNSMSDADFPQIQPSTMTNYPPMGRGLSVGDYSMGRGQPMGRGVPSMQQPMERAPAPMPTMGRGMLQSAGGGMGSDPVMQGLGHGMQGLGLSGPTMGRGTAMTRSPKPGSMQGLYQTSTNQQTTVGRPAGYDDPHGVDEFDDDDDDDDDDDAIVPLRRPGQPPVRAQAPQHRPVNVEPIPPPTVQNIPVKTIQNMAGRGRGNILETLLSKGIKPGVSIGRGYAPADWVDDGSIGPLCK